LGATYVYERNLDISTAWDSSSFAAYIKAPKSREYDLFGISVSLSADGDTLAVGAREWGYNKPKLISRFN